MVPFIDGLGGEIVLSFELVAGVFAGYSNPKERCAAPLLDIDIAEGDHAIEAVAADWRHIERAGGATTPFQTLAVGAAAASVHLRRGETPRIVIVRRAGRPTALLPTVIGRSAGVKAIRFLGDPLSQYGDIVAVPEATREHVEAAWRAAADPRVAKLIHLRKVRADSRLAPILDRAATMVAETEAPFVALDGAYNTEPSRTRQQRRSHKRLAAHGTIRFEILRGAEAQPALRRALDLKRQWLEQRGLRSRVVGDPDWEMALMMLAGETGRASPLAVARLSAGGRTVAIEIGFEHARRWCSFLGAYEPAFARTGPGHVQIAEAIAHCVANGITVYDLLPPGDAYKRDIADGAVAVRDYAVPLCASGLAAMLATRAAPAIKGVVERMPPMLRRATLARK